LFVLAGIINKEPITLDEQKKNIRSRLRRYLDNLYTLKDGVELLREMRKAENKDIVDELSAEVWEESRSNATTTEERREEYRKEAHRLFLRIENPFHLWLRRIGISAAVAASVFLIAGAGYYFYNQQQMQTTYACVTTSFGEHRDVVLPDGTQIAMNSCSRLVYPNKFTGKERKVRLTGEAFFRVVHNEKKPFFVTTGHFNVKVLGTQFNVKSYPDDEIESIRVKSGKVQVDLPEAMMRITDKEEIVINTLSGEYSKRITSDEMGIWLDDRATLCFNSTPIRDAARELERIYHCHIAFAKGQRFDNLISGAHDNANLETILKSIEFISGIHFKIKGDEVLLYH
jgi:transmembrane sensor